MLARQPTGRSCLRNDNSARVACESRNAKEQRISELIHGLRQADKLAAQGHARCPHHQQKPLFLVRRNGYAQPGRMSWASVERSACGTDFMATHLAACQGRAVKACLSAAARERLPRQLYSDGQRLAGGKMRDQDGRRAGWASHTSSTASTVWRRCTNEVKVRGGICEEQAELSSACRGDQIRRRCAPTLLQSTGCRRPTRSRQKITPKLRVPRRSGPLSSPELASSSPISPQPSSAQQSHWFCYRQPFSARPSWRQLCWKPS